MKEEAGVEDGATPAAWMQHQFVLCPVMDVLLPLLLQMLATAR